MRTTEHPSTHALEEQLTARLERCTNLPSPPRVAERIIALGQDPTVTIDSVVKLISLDPAQTAKLLRMARSPLYARRRKVENLRQAIALFGLTGTLNLALSFSLVSSLRTKGSSGLDHSLYWRRSLAAATSSQVLGKRLNIEARDDLFLIALLQDIGMLALEKVAPELYQDIGPHQVDHQRVINDEQAAIGTDHAAVGAWLLERWSLPERYVKGVAYSHDPKSFPKDDEHARLTCCVAVSGLIADILLHDDVAAATERTAAQAESLLDVDRAGLAAVLEVVEVALQDTASLFEIDSADPAQLELILSQAKDVLLLRSLQTAQEADQFKTTAASLETRTRELEEATRRDPLTGLFNRRCLDELAQREFEAAKDHGWPLAIAYIDLDHFKKVNDSHGHAAGDQVLRGAAGLLIRQARDTDVVARYGGEEFVILLPGTGLDGAKVMAQRILGACRSTQHDIGETTLGVTVSIGIVIFGEGAEFGGLHELFQAADRALYAAKEGGRDRYVIHK